MANKYWVGGTGTWSSSNTANWSLTSGGTGGAAVPTTADVAIFDNLSSATTYTVTRTATTAVLGINLAGPASGTLTFAGNSSIGITTSGLTIASTGVSWTNTGLLTFTGSCTITTNGVNLTSSLTLNPGAGSISLGSAFTSTTVVTHTSGTFRTQGFNFTCAAFSSSNTNLRTLNITNSIVTVTNTFICWELLTTTNLTFVSTGSTIVFSNASSVGKTFDGGGLTYNNFQFAGAGIATYTFTGANTFTGTISSTKTVAFTITLPASTTTTVGGWTVAGTSGNLVTLNSSTAGTQGTLTLTGGGTVSVDYLAIQDSAATPSTLTWYAGANSTNTSNNTGWIFTAPPGPIIASRLTKTGVLYANGYFDEVTQATISTSPTALYSAQFDEVTLNGQPSPQRRELSTGVVQVNGYFDETAGPLT